MAEGFQIVVPVDFAPHTQKLADYAAMVAEKFGGSLRFIHVCRPLGVYGGFAHHSFDVATKEMLTYYERKMSNLVDKHLGSIGKVVLGDAADEILSFAGDIEAELIVIGSVGSKGLEKVVMGSVAERVVRLSPCPTLIFGPQH
ncbi:MAG: universal stress protein [Thermodesulfobacteriota bacterium]